jgi:hypothetical protein
MTEKLSPYKAITPRLAASGTLVTITTAAEAYGCSAATLKGNAKARRLLAYQERFGAPVMVEPATVEGFLSARPDIASRLHPKAAAPLAAAVAAEHAPIEHVVIAAVPSMGAGGDFPFPDDKAVVSGPGDLGLGFSLRSLNNTTPAERALVANCLSEFARAINDTIAPNAGKNLPKNPSQSYPSDVPED